MWAGMARYSRRRNYDPGNMGKGDGIVLEGEIVENLPNTQFRVHLPEMDKSIIAVVSGKMRRNWVRLLVGDMVRVEFSPYDLERARIIAKIR